MSFASNITEQDKDPAKHTMESPTNSESLWARRPTDDEATIAQLTQSQLVERAVALLRSPDALDLTSLGQVSWLTGEAICRAIDDLRLHASCPSWCTDHSNCSGYYEKPDLYHEHLVGKTAQGGIEVGLGAEHDLLTGTRSPTIVTIRDLDLDLEPDEARMLAALLLEAAELAEVQP